MDRGALWTIVRGVTKELDTQTHTHKRIGHNLVTKQQQQQQQQQRFGITL